jgi:hypothetical protein
MDRMGVGGSALAGLDGIGRKNPPTTIPRFIGGLFSHKSGQFNSYVGDGMFLLVPATKKSS